MPDSTPDRPAPESAAAPRVRMPLHWRILLGLVVGAALGLAANMLAARQPTPGVVDSLDLDANGVHDRLDWWALNVVDPLGKVFLRLIFMAVIPLVFSALALGAVGIGNVRRLGRVGLRTLGYTVAFSGTAVVLGLALVNLIQPGRMLTPQQQATLRAQYDRGADDTLAKARQAKPLKDALLDIIPENPLQEMTGALDASSKGNGMLAVMFFALVFGLAIAYAPDRCQTLLGWLEGLNAVAMVIIDFAMRLAPYGVGCLVFGITARLGLSLVPPLAGFALTVLLGLAVQLVVVYSLALWWTGSMSPLAFFRGISDAMLTAFGTSSSSATLPTSLHVAQENLRLPREVSNFVLTIGATGNQNGTALYEGVVVLFLAQVFHVELTLVQQVTVVLMSVLAGIGTAGVPGGSLPMIAAVLQSVGVPGEGIGIILGIDRILDMCRTVLNVTGDLAIATCVARWESEHERA
jgi:DAACS family dicarboxylate/amino acid:cation (Na+ or H+) symporter